MVKIKGKKVHRYEIIWNYDSNKKIAINRIINKAIEYELLFDSKEIENAVGFDRIIFYISFFTISI